RKEPGTAPTRFQPFRLILGLENARAFPQACGHPESGIRLESDQKQGLTSLFSVNLGQSLTEILRRTHTVVDQCQVRANPTRQKV
ncbi:MAG: hypothetical protein WCB12_07805, partial [Bryobacteraceae bacterium]